ncbi:MAG: error-prone DNA polymerase [Alphaproteobacteria bacterium]|nr:error-prone DNA polymerase [Alphaproteobacteria bacterium]
MSYAELQITSNFSFLRGSSHPDELAITAKALGLRSIALTDRNTLAGVVRAHVSAKEHGLAFIPACRLDLQDGPSLLAYPTDRPAYAQLSSLLTTGNRRAPKGECYIWRDDVINFSKGIIFALIPPPDFSFGPERIAELREQLQARIYLAASYRYHSQDKRRLAKLQGWATYAGTPLLATNDILYHEPDRRIIADTMTCIRTHSTIDTAGYLLGQNAERFLKPAHEMMRLFTDHPEAIDATCEIAEACSFSLDELQYEYPHETAPDGFTPQKHLEQLAVGGLKSRFSGAPEERFQKTLAHELRIVSEKNYAPYFLTVHDIVVYARKNGILCQGRGSAANSLICYALGITEVDPIKVDLLFERFVSDARVEPPDIDVDFEHERREEVIQYIYEKYGRDCAGLAATTITYKMRSAIRDVGKVMGLSEDTISALAGTVWGSYGREIPDHRVREAGFDPEDKNLKLTLQIAHELIGFPRHLSQHVGGFVLTEKPLHEIVPIQNAAMDGRTVIEWNKDDLDALNILKVDILALGMLSCLRGTFDLLKQHHKRNMTLASMPKEDPQTYDMLCKADSIGVFQVESRAQMSMLPRLKPRKFYDLVVQVAIVRPGPIQGNMVHPYLRRRQGKEKVDYPSPKGGLPNELKGVLEKTFGVPLFQEQAMKIAIVAAGFTPEDADKLRRSMASFRNMGTIHKFHQQFVTGMTCRGYEPDFAERCFEQIKGFADYGFPESHAASFALLVYASAWVKCHYPDVFACALLNAQPMGFYAPAQIVRDATDHGVEIREADVNHSHWFSTLEPAPENHWRFAVRLGLRQITGIKEKTAEQVTGNRIRPYLDVEDLHARCDLSVSQIEKLAEADAFRSAGLNRRQALWQVKGLKDTPNLPLFMHADTAAIGKEESVSLPDMALSEHVVTDYQTMRLSLKAHPISFLRSRYTQRGIIRCSELHMRQNGAQVMVAGLVLVRQRPGSAKGVVFLTIEDETGIANIIVWQKVFESYRATLMGSRLLVISGELQHEDNVTHIVAHSLKDDSQALLNLSGGTKLSPYKQSNHPRNIRGLIPASRDFH